MTKQLRGDRNQCAACGNYFNSTAAFDKHRVGEFGRDRGCMGWLEMAHVGMHYGADGFWRGSKRLDSFFRPPISTQHSGSPPHCPQHVRSLSVRWSA